jgi:hypothetical protein
MMILGSKSLDFFGSGYDTGQNFDFLAMKYFEETPRINGIH